MASLAGLTRTVRWMLVGPPKWLSANWRWNRLSLGSLNRLSPVSDRFGLDRGQPIDRVFIERFLEENRHRIRGTVLEVESNVYTKRFGGDDVTRSEVLHAVDGNPRATIVDDLARGRRLPDGAFDCVILTQTLQYVFELESAVRTLHRILAPDGTLLLTVPGISQETKGPKDAWDEYWRFTSSAIRKLLAPCFGADNVSVCAFGNVMLAAAFLYGLAAKEVDRAAFSQDDPRYEFLICARARKRR